jgi:hypothetical protein
MSSLRDFFTAEAAETQTRRIDIIIEKNDNTGTMAKILKECIIWEVFEKLSLCVT